VKPFVLKPCGRLKGRVFPLGDKSISHRAVICCALSPAKTVIRNFPFNQDCLSTVRAFKNLGVRIDVVGGIKALAGTLAIYGRGIFGLSKPGVPIMAGDSGTTYRILLGVLAGQKFTTRLLAGKGLSRRPMARVTGPLRRMGAEIEATTKRRRKEIEEYPPVQIQGRPLRGMTYRIPVASAQVKSALLYAGLYATGCMRLIEPIKTRDHTERMLKLFKADIRTHGNQVVLRGRKELVSPAAFYIPGDISSAAFFIVMAAILPGSEIVVHKVSLNPSRMGVVRVLRRMRGRIRIKNQGVINGAEPQGDIHVQSSRLQGTTVEKEEIPALIDELPVLMVAACYAQGRTIFQGVGELRVKETDRIRSMSENLSKMGASITVLTRKRREDIVIEGGRQLWGARVKSFSDHRTAMSLIAAGIAAKGTTTLDDISCISKSFPHFINILNSLVK